MNLFSKMTDEERKGVTAREVTVLSNVKVWVARTYHSGAAWTDKRYFSLNMALAQATPKTAIFAATGAEFNEQLACVDKAMLAAVLERNPSLR